MLATHSVLVKDDLPELIALVDAVMRDGSDQSFLTDYPLVYRDGNLKNIHVVKVGGAIVAEVPYIPKWVRCERCELGLGIISPTATDPKHRHRGYGLACVRAAAAQMQRLGVELSILWTQVATFPFYEHAGFQAVRDLCTVYPLYAADAPLFADHGHEVVIRDPTSGEDLEDLHRLHAQQGPGVVRSADECAALLSLPRMRTLVARSGGRSVAYVVASAAPNRPGLVEGAGDAEALETLLCHTLSNWQGPEPVPAYGTCAPTSLGHVLERAVRERRVPWGQSTMIRINLVRRFFESIAPWLQRRAARVASAFSLEVSDTGETISFEPGHGGLHLGEQRLDDHHVLSRRELTSAVFGEHLERRVKIPAPLRRLFPFSFPIWQLDHS